jgi:S-adenosylmethionine:tRNA ribosyltransferase-isomerase
VHAGDAGTAARDGVHMVRMTLRTDELDFRLPEELIATHPVSPRDAARLLVVSRSDPAVMEHRVFRDLPTFLHPGDVLVTNASAVIPARIFARRADTGGRVEGLFLIEPEPGVWKVLLKSNGKLRAGQAIGVVPRADDDAAPRATLELIERSGDGWLARLTSPAGRSAQAVLREVGATPLPPYILAQRSRRADATPDELDRGEYQTVYADDREAHSVAAPTAGLHFTQRLIDEIEHMGVARHKLLLHVGEGTFKPVTADTLGGHDMHSERITVPRETIKAARAARTSGGKLVLVGTTCVRAMESLPDDLPEPTGEKGYSADTSLYILPGFDFRWTDALITNFHLPRSTLLAMVGALFPEGVPRLLEIYRRAIEERYRFYSYGDAMLILP